MPIVVQKFGGSSVADAEALRLVAKQVVDRKRAGNSVVVVVSAMGETTDRLLAMAREVSETPPRREVDMLVTAGERISMALLSMAIHEAGEGAISFTGSQSGIITEDSHGGARIIEVRPYRIRENLEAGRIVIVAGYQGVSKKKEVTTLGRGGTDTTAVAMAAALDAAVCEIYSDVDGVYSADPRVCPQAKLLKTLTYETMHAMAGAGARVLNAEAVEYARRAGILVWARKTGDNSGRKTEIGANHRIPAGRAVAVVGAKNVGWLYGGCADPEAVIAGVKAAGGHLIAHCLNQGSAGPQISLIVRCEDLAPASALDELAARYRLAVEHPAAVTVVGNDLAAQGDLPPFQGGARGYGWIGNAVSCSYLVPHEDCDGWVRRLHQRLVESAPGSGVGGDLLADAGDQLLESS